MYTNKSNNLSTQGQRFVAWVLFVVCLLGSGNLERALTAPGGDGAVVPAKHSLTAQALATLLENTTSKNYDARQEAFDELAGLEATPILFQSLLQAIKDRNISEVEGQALVHLRDIASECLPVLLAATQDQNTLVRQAAFQALEARDLKRVSDFLKIISVAIKDKDCWLHRLIAVRMINDQPRLKPTFLRYLLQATKDADVEVSYEASEALEAAFNTLMNRKNIAPEYLPVLFEAIQDQNPLASQALARLKVTPTSLRYLLQAIKNEDRNVSEAAVQALAHLKDITPKCLPVLEEAIKDQDKRVRLAVVQTLKAPWTSGNFDGINLMALEEGLSRSLECLALNIQDKKFNPQHDKYCQSLAILHQAIEKDQDEDVRLATIEAFKVLRARDSKSVAALQKVKREEPKTQVCNKATECLEAMNAHQCSIM